MQVISCSRRSDIPRCHPGWLDERLRAGRVDFRSPRGIPCSVSLLAEDVHSLVLISKDYRPLLADEGLAARVEKLNPFFHFTITGLGGGAWEPDVRPWRHAVETAAALVSRFGASRVNWRFDPIVFWPENGGAGSNLSLFNEMADTLAELGLTGFTFSFAHWYVKSVRRAGKAGAAFLDPSPEELVERAHELVRMAGEAGFTAAGCCQEVLAEVPGLKKSRCIDGERLSALRPDRMPAAGGKDRSQRPSCGCTPSIDIGSYTQRCAPNPCLYCYAN
jgi:hypothetical protein